MVLADVPLFGMLKTRMSWLQDRQRVLAQNVANSDTPGYQTRDLAPVDFRRSLASQASPTVLAITDRSHITGAASAEEVRFAPARPNGFEVRPSGNAVVLEDEMLKVAQNQLDYQTATSLYSRGLNLVRTALGKAR